MKNKKQPIKIEFVFIESQKLISKKTFTRAFVVSDKDCQIRRRNDNENVIILKTRPGNSRKIWKCYFKVKFGSLISKQFYSLLQNLL